jgi:hypothetical protein
VPNSEELLLHQVHQAKLAADVGASVVSLTLMWRGYRTAGLAVHYLVPVVASLALLRADTSRLRATRRGRYVLQHMPPAAQAVRLTGDAVMTLGAWRRSGLFIATGGLIVLLGWSHGVMGARG